MLTKVHQLPITASPPQSHRLIAHDRRQQQQHQQDQHRWQHQHCVRTTDNISHVPHPPRTPRTPHAHAPEQTQPHTKSQAISIKHIMIFSKAGAAFRVQMGCIRKGSIASGAQLSRFEICSIVCSVARARDDGESIMDAYAADQWSRESPIIYGIMCYSKNCNFII